MFRILMIKNLISNSTTKFLIRLLLKYLIWCFLDDLNLIWWLDRIIFVTFCQSSEANLNQRWKNFVVCESKLSRKFVCFERSLRRNNESIMFRSAHSQRVYYVSLFSLNDQNQNESIMLRFVHWLYDRKLCFFDVRVSYNEHDVSDFDIM